MRKLILGDENEPDAIIEEIEIRLDNRVGDAKALAKLNGWDAPDKSEQKVEIVGALQLTPLKRDHG